MSLPRYPSYKPSGVEWLGAVPEHWRMVILKRLSRIYSGGTPDREINSYWESGSIPWINSGAVNQRLINEPSDFITEEALRNSSARWVPKEALVMALAGQGKTKGMVAQTVIATTCNQSMAAICPNASTAPRYLYWLLDAQYVHIRNMAGGDHRDGLNLEILGSIPCLELPLEEQNAIANFLDYETAKIDALVEEQQKLIGLLQEKRQAVILHAVTKGLNPDAPMKDSGIEWLGQVPEHWEIWKHSHLFTSSMGQTILKEQVSDAGAIPVLSATEEHEIFGYLETATVLLNDGDLVIPARGNSIGHVKLVRELCTTTQTTIYSKSLSKKVVSKFAFYFLSGNRETLFQFDRTAIPQLTVNQVSTNPFLLPPLVEQDAIVTYLDDKTAVIDSFASVVGKAISLLQERRSALISAAVTGQIDVRTQNQN